MNKREITETWFRRVWLEEDLDAIGEMMSADAPVTGLRKTPQLGAADFKTLVQALLGLINETTVTIDNYMENGDWISVLMNISARNRHTGAPVQANGLAMARIVDGKIVEAYNYVDFIELFEQLNILPPDTLNKCLCGDFPG